ncbi:Uncharacterized protein AKI40_0258 [Enterobacter sp. FY-07]|uniref:Imm50 family immunity protein n=1 Tax=Kosakonia oryzendophytica TaxID=1005665 RepID=UPI0007780406|nr:Imm50 family immunity protein [Kosakonia oryzendophytica]AMO46686.1 Uncharacterized protein AKI40_0258 [Enterobacter sp. FY-07]WBT58462.1 Imm50 family immunity protein [Kosakonia oryzendophytica]
MYWNDLDGTFLLRKVFLEPVEISTIDLFSIKFDREGPMAYIEFDLVGALPNNPPPKWVKNYNRCRCGLNCSGIKMLKMDGIKTNMIVNIRIEDRNKIFISGDDFSLTLECLHIQFAGPSVYIA